MTIVEDRRAITGGVDTHSEAHVAAALDAIGGLLGVREFPATSLGYAGLLGWLGEFGDVATRLAAEGLATATEEDGLRTR
jgi:transposase